MSSSKTPKSLSLSDLPASEKARIGRLAREVLSLRRQIASAKSSEVNSTNLVDTSAVEAGSDGDDIRVALREAAASLAAADAAQRRAESRESTAQRTLEAQRELWKQREREYSQVLRAAELTLTTMRKRTADFDELVAELAMYRAKYPNIQADKPSSKQPTPNSSRRSSISAISSVPERSQDTPAAKPTADASSTFLRLLPRELVALADSSTLPVAPPEVVLSRCSSTDSTAVAPINLESQLKTPIPTLADRLRELINSEPSLPQSLPNTQQKDSIDASMQADSSEFSHPVAVPASIQPKQKSKPIRSLPLQSADDDMDLDSAIAALKFHCDADALEAARRHLPNPRQSVPPSTRKLPGPASTTKPLLRPRSIESKSSKRADKISETDEMLWKLVWNELK